ncbi:hypothetical protein GCM10027168_33780 [Streptomyces capparidis]
MLQLRVNWQKSSFSGGDARCVEVARQSRTILLRESTDPAEVLTTTVPRLRELLLAVKAGRF